MNINNMTRKEFEALPSRGSFSEDVGVFDSLVILPSRQKHDSGYRCLDFVAAREQEPICRLSGCSDVIHIDGIGGWGWRWLERYGKCPDVISPVGWSIDCLPKSGLLRIFCGKSLRAGAALSSFEIYAIEEKP